MHYCILAWNNFPPPLFPPFPPFADELFRPEDLSTQFDIKLKGVSREAQRVPLHSQIQFFSI